LTVNKTWVKTILELLNHRTTPAWINKTRTLLVTKLITNQILLKIMITFSVEICPAIMVLVMEMILDPVVMNLMTKDRPKEVEEDNGQTAEAIKEVVINKTAPTSAITSKLSSASSSLRIENVLMAQIALLLMDQVKFVI
jgi:hypothetical protein